MQKVSSLVYISNITISINKLCQCTPCRVRLMSTLVDNEHVVTYACRYTQANRTKTMKDEQVQDLSRQWLDWKAREKHAIEQRKKIEEQLRILSEKNEGTTSIKVKGFKIQITEKIKRILDANKLRNFVMDEDIRKNPNYQFLCRTVVQNKPTLSMASFKTLYKIDSELAKKFEVRVITTEPASPYIKIEEN